MGIMDERTMIRCLDATMIVTFMTVFGLLFKKIRDTLTEPRRVKYRARIDRKENLK